MVPSAEGAAKLDMLHDPTTIDSRVSEWAGVLGDLSRLDVGKERLVHVRELQDHDRIIKA